MEEQRMMKFGRILLYQDLFDHEKEVILRILAEHFPFFVDTDPVAFRKASRDFYNEGNVYIIRKPDRFSVLLRQKSGDTEVWSGNAFNA